MQNHGAVSANSTQESGGRQKRRVGEREKTKHRGRVSSRESGRVVL